MQINKAHYVVLFDHKTASKTEMQMFAQLVVISFMGLTIIHMEGYVLSSGQWNIVNSGEILWIGRLPGGNEKMCPCGLWELLQCRTL